MADDAAASLGADIQVLSQEPVTGGFSDASKVRLQVLRTEHGRRVEQALLLKQTSQVEVNALTAAALVPGADAVPEVIETGNNNGGPYIVTAFYDGAPANDESTLPPNVIETLARMHAHYLVEPVPPQLPVIDPDWWRAKCDVATQRLSALDRPVASDLGAQVQDFKDDPKMIDALQTLPRTLIHGDVHRNNVLVDRAGHGRLLDWGGSFVGAPALDIANLGGPSSRGNRTYLATWQKITGRTLTHEADWARSNRTATVWARIKYLAFATKTLGDAAGQAMITEASEALDQL